jgi:prepilin-type N-terminal cleavage/methylation domain-containing protein
MFVKTQIIAKGKTRQRRGLTLSEMMVAAVIGGIALLSVGIVLSSNHQGFNSMYNRVFSDVVTDGHNAKRMFDFAVRQSSCYKAILDLDEGHWVEVHYYEAPSSVFPDRYKCFYYEDTHLYVERGRILEDGEKETIDFEAFCGNVSNCVFKQTGRSIQMILTLNNGSEQITTVTSAVMHN